MSDDRNLSIESIINVVRLMEDQCRSDLCGVMAKTHNGSIEAHVKGHRLEYRFFTARLCDRHCQTLMRIFNELKMVKYDDT